LQLTKRPTFGLLTNMSNNNVLPQIIILYGPSNAGKGTQSAYLKKLFPERYHLDFGSELRSFVSRNIGDINQHGENINVNAKAEDVAVARSLKTDMSASNPAKTEDLKYVIESAITNCIKSGQGMIVEGPGRLVEEAQWLSGFMDSQEAEVCIFHLHISLEEALERATKRYYVKGIDRPFMSLEDAQAECKEGQEPYKRGDDLDPEGIKKRYTNMYSENFALITSIYQLGAKAQVFTLDGRKHIEEVSADIAKYLERFYGWKV
jgi:adenylate kinase family enzyme